MLYVLPCSSSSVWFLCYGNSHSRFMIGTFLFFWSLCVAQQVVITLCYVGLGWAAAEIGARLTLQALEWLVKNKGKDPVPPLEVEYQLANNKMQYLLLWANAHNNMSPIVFSGTPQIQTYFPQVGLTFVRGVGYLITNKVSCSPLLKRVLKAVYQCLYSCLSPLILVFPFQILAAFSSQRTR